MNDVVFIGSTKGNLYGLDATTGAQLWRMALGAAIPPTTFLAEDRPLTGLSAGDGLLVVPAGTTLTAYVLSPTP